MADGDCGDERLVGEDPVREVGRQLIGEQADEGNVELAGAHLLGHVPAAGVLDGDLDGGVPLVERGEGALHHRRGLTGAADHAQPEPAGEHPGQLGQFGACQSSSASTARARGNSSSPAAASAHRSAGPLEQGDAVLAFQPGDLIAQRGLHDVTTRRGPGEVQLLGDGDEVLELADIHLVPRLIQSKSCVGLIDTYRPETRFMSTHPAAPRRSAASPC